MRDAISALLLVTAVLGAGCGETDARASESGRPVVDSAIPVEAALERFRRNLPRIDRLRGGADSREALVRELVAGLERSDTTALRRLMLQKDEFAWLYYPASHWSRPPYELPPELLWFQMQGQSDKGASLLLSDRAGAPLGYLRHDCGLEREEGRNRLFGHCVVRRVGTAGDTVRDRLFGLILERDGVYKFVSYANKLD